MWSAPGRRIGTQRVKVAGPSGRTAFPGAAAVGLGPSRDGAYERKGKESPAVGPHPFPEARQSGLVRAGTARTNEGAAPVKKTVDRSPEARIMPPL